MAEIFRLMPDNITPLWDQIEELITPALVLVSTHTAEDIRRSVMSMEAQLWAQMDGDIVEAVCTTEFARYPSGLFVRVWLTGARPDRRLDTQAIYGHLLTWCVAHKCQGFEAIGRAGWLRRFSNARVEGLVMRLLI